MTRFEYLLKGYTEDRLTAGELQEFLELAEKYESLMKEKILEDLNSKTFTGETSQEQRERMYNIVQSKIQRDIAALNSNEQTDEIKEIAVLRSMLVWKKLIAAASIILVVGISSYFLFFDKSGTPAEVVQTTTPANDIKAPKTNRAMITLADGKTVALDSVTSGMLAQQGNVKLVKLADGQIAYQTLSGELINEIQYNTLTNPRGSKVIDMTLADGSRVWLNAGSSVTYPVAFVDNERKVNITGEAYFEISHDASKPFKVTKGDFEVAVLGTHFNVNAYDDEKEIKVTLLKGSVEVKLKNAKLKIVPGQQAKTINNEQLSINKNVDLEEVMAWKNGLFIMHKAEMGTIMREVSRWYNVEIVYHGEIPKGRISGDLPRSMNLSKVLQVMTLSGVEFNIEGSKVMVME